MGDLFGPQQRTLELGQLRVSRTSRAESWPYSCGPGGVPRILRYSSTIMPVTPIRSNRRDRVRLERSTLVGGIWAFAAFQLSPPCGRSMASASGGPSSPPNRQGQVVRRRVYDPRAPVAAAVVVTMVVVSHVALRSLSCGRCRSSRCSRRRPEAGRVRPSSFSFSSGDKYDAEMSTDRGSLAALGD